jgi:hypothetical protein
VLDGISDAAVGCIVGGECIITAEDRRPVGANCAAFDDRLDAFARRNSVHMSGEHQRHNAGNGALDSRNKIASVGVGAFARIVIPTDGTGIFGFVLQPYRYVAFGARERVDLNKFEEELRQSS